MCATSNPCVELIHVNYIWRILVLNQNVQQLNILQIL